MPAGDPDGHDLRSLVRFWLAHGLVGTRPRQRMHVVGGMWSYCDAFAAWLRARGGTLQLGARVERIARGAGGVRIGYERAGRQHACVADHVVIAADASRVGGMLADADDDEHRALASVRYEHAEVVVHRDPRLMPRDRAAWGAYQFYVARAGEQLTGPSITFYPHRLAGLADAAGIFVSLNPPIAPRAELVIATQRLVHPVANPTAARTDLFTRVQGRRNTWYAGSYLQAPSLHEQAFESGARAADAIARRAADDADLATALAG
jgi:predicted NAD/FAD-binding protein